MTSPLYTWRRNDGPHMGESAWSIINKFCYRNALNESDFFKHFNCVLEKPYRNRYRKSDILLNTSWILNFVSCTLDISELQKTMSTIEYLTGSMNADQVEAITSQHLRFCPICIKVGYHSTINQLCFRKHCPVHPETNLKDDCPSCGCIIPYVIPGSFNLAYACPSCNYLLWERGNCCANVGAISSSSFNYLTSISNSIIGCANSKHIYTNKFEMLFEYADEYLNHEIKPTLTAITTVNLKSSIAEVINERNMVHIDAVKEGFKPTYKSISRHITKNLLRRKYVTGLATLENTKCYAYEQWRSYWENLNERLPNESLWSSKNHDIDQEVIKSFFSLYHCKGISSIISIENSPVYLNLFSQLCIRSYFDFLDRCIELSTKGQWQPRLSYLNDGAMFFTFEWMTTGLCKIHFFRVGQRLPI